MRQISFLKRSFCNPGIALSLIAFAISLRMLPGLRIIDDAYITYRYARNIVRGVGFVYNPGEYVLGTTTPLYTLLLAALGWIAQSEAFPQISVVLNALADGFSTMLLYFIAWRLTGHRLPGLLLGLLWAVAPKSVTFAIGGMETSLYIALMLGAFAAWLAERTRLSAVLAALATLTRPDALIWIGPLALTMIVNRWHSRRQQPTLRRLPWLEGGLYLTVLLPWLIYGTLTFGSPLTRSIAAKAIAYQLPPTHALVALIQHYSTPFFEHLSFGSSGALIGSLLYLLLASFGSLFLIRANWRSVPLVVFPWLYFLTFALANPLMFRWYTAPPTPLYFLCIVAGAWGLAKRLLGAKRGQWITAATGTVWLALSLRAWTLHPAHGPTRPTPEMAWFELEQLYEQVGRELAPYVDKETVIAAGDIGAIGWYSDARILDTLGLVSPQATVYYPLDPSMLATAPYAVAPDLIFDQKPDYIVILETYGRNGLLREPRLAEQYRLREKIETTIYGSDGMLVYERRGK